LLLSLHGKLQNINPVKVDKTTIINRVSSTTGFRIRPFLVLMIDKRVDDVIDILSPEAL
jgi:hypothetical protein